MEAAEAKVQRVLEGSKQFLVPHFQRPYSWQEPQWKTLWRDLTELASEADAKPHFIGSIVTAPARSVPEGVEKRLLIDGQQRLTTLMILLSLIAARAREKGIAKVAERIEDFVTNRHEEGHEHYKLLPTQGEDPGESDREAFIRLIDSSPSAPGGGIGKAAKYFSARMQRSDAPDPETLLRVITTKLTLVSIILDEKDNPHRIFESLNGTGRPLSQADLIRNFFFMRIHEREHEKIWTELWRPMQRRLGEDALTDFIRHYLTSFGSLVRETDVYAALKARVDEAVTRTPVEHLRELAAFSKFYEVLLDPKKESEPRLRERLARLERLEVTVAYPLLLPAYACYAAGTLSLDALCRLLDVVETFVVRRFVCGVPTYGMNKIFAPLYAQAGGGEDLVAAVARTLSNPRSTPRDERFRESLRDASLYGGGERREKTKLLLERIEASFGHKEVVHSGNLTIEHVMPQTLTEEWERELGPGFEEVHDAHLHTLGNLTLTSYNSELSNLSFAEKKKRFEDSHLELNRYFASVEQWNAEEIDRRAGALVERALAIWPAFGPDTASDDDVANGEIEDVTGSVPRIVRIRDREVPVQSWVDVAVATMEALIALGGSVFADVMAAQPKFVNIDATAFRRSSRLRKLSNGAYLETNLSAAAFHKACLQAIRLAGFGGEEWSVVRADDDGDDAGDIANAPSLVKQTQLELWTEVRAALVKTGQWPNLRTPRPQYWFDLSIGRTGAVVSLVANTLERFVGVKLMLYPDIADQALELLLAERGSVETEIGAPLNWNPHPEKQTKSIRLTSPANILDRAAWPAAIEWLVGTSGAFAKAFGPRLARLDAGRRKESVDAS